MGHKAPGGETHGLQSRCGDRLSTYQEENQVEKQEQKNHQSKQKAQQ